MPGRQNMLKQKSIMGIRNFPPPGSRTISVYIN
jgi:hypothetical protein